MDNERGKIILKDNRYSIDTINKSLVFDENANYLLIKSKGHHVTINEQKVWIKTNFILAERHTSKIVWKHQGRLLLKQLKELKDKFGFETKLN